MSLNQSFVRRWARAAGVGCVASMLVMGGLGCAAHVTPEQRVIAGDPSAAYHGSMKSEWRMSSAGGASVPAQAPDTGPVPPEAVPGGK